MESRPHSSTSWSREVAHSYDGAKTAGYSSCKSQSRPVVQQNGQRTGSPYGAIQTSFFLYLTRPKTFCFCKLYIEHVPKFIYVKQQNAQTIWRYSNNKEKIMKQEENLTRQKVRLRSYQINRWNCFGKLANRGACTANALYRGSKQAKW